MLDPVVEGRAGGPTAVGGLCFTGAVRPFDPRLARYATGVRRLIGLSVALGVASAVVVVVQAILLAGILADVIIGGAGPDQVAGRLGALAVVIAIRAALAWAAEELAGRSASAVTAGLRRDLVLHAAALGPRWRSGEHGGRLAVLATTGVESLHDYLARYLPQLVLSVVVPVIMLIYLFSADLTSGIIVLVTLPLIPLFMALVGWYTDRQTRAKWASLSRLAAHFTDVVAGLPTLKVFGRAKAQAEAVRRVTDDYRSSSMVTLRVAFLSSMVLELLASLSVALVAVAIGLRLVYGGLTLEVGLAVLILAPGGLPAAAPAGHPVPRRRGRGRGGRPRCSTSWTRRRRSPAPARDLTAPFGIRVDAATVGQRRGARGGRAADARRRRPAGSPWSPETAGPARPRCCSSSPGCCGRTPDAVRVATGAARMPSRSPTWIPGGGAASWAWAAQGGALQAGTIRQNLALGQTDAGRATLRSALLAADAAGFVDALPGGLEHRLGDGGSRAVPGAATAADPGPGPGPAGAGAPARRADRRPGRADRAAGARGHRGG